MSFKGQSHNARREACSTRVFFLFFALSHHSHFHVHGDSTILCLCPDLLHFKDAAGETMVPSSTVTAKKFAFTKLV
jgi:hypothetical protein